MRLLLKRDPRSDGVTMGDLFVNGIFEAFTLEPDDEGEHPAIPEGIYRVVINFSSRFKKMLPLVVDVPGRLGIRFHSGNEVDDTEGCILLGTTRTKSAVFQSRVAMTAFQSKLAKALADGETVSLEVTRKPDDEVKALNA